MYPDSPHATTEDEPTMTDVRGVLPGQRPPVDATVLDEPTSEVPVIRPTTDARPGPGDPPDDRELADREPADTRPETAAEDADGDEATTETIPEGEVQMEFDAARATKAPEVPDTGGPGPASASSEMGKMSWNPLPRAEPGPAPGDPVADAALPADPVTDATPPADPVTDATPPAKPVAEAAPPAKPATGLGPAPAEPPESGLGAAPTTPRQFGFGAAPTAPPEPGRRGPDRPVWEPPAPDPAPEPAATPEPAAAPESPAAAAPEVTAPEVTAPEVTTPEVTTPEPEAEQAPLRPGEVVEERIALWAEEAAARLRDQWRDLQGQFIDDPEAAVAGAKQLVTDAVHDLADTLLAAQDALDPYREADRVDTEAMRVAMRRYREFLDRVLAL